MNYKIQEVNSVFEVFETQTEQVIKTFDTKEKARKFMKSLNLGNGFDGWTPSFFVKKIDIKGFLKEETV